MLASSGDTVLYRRALALGPLTPPSQSPPLSPPCSCAGQCGVYSFQGASNFTLGVDGAPVPTVISGNFKYGLSLFGPHPKVRPLSPLGPHPVVRHVGFGFGPSPCGTACRVRVWVRVRFGLGFGLVLGQGPSATAKLQQSYSKVTAKLQQS